VRWIGGVVVVELSEFLRSSALRCGAAVGGDGVGAGIMEVGKTAGR